MKITEKKIRKTGLILEVNIEESDYLDSVETSLLDYRKKMNLPGFRPGKVPMSIVKKKYQLPAKVEEINKLLSSNIQQHITEKKISIIGGPIPVEENIDFINNVDYTFKYELGLQPELDLSLGEKSKIDYLEISPEDNQINQHLIHLRKRYGQIIHSDIIESGDMLNVYFLELDDSNKPKEGGVTNSTSLLIDKIDDKEIKHQFLKLKKSDTIIISPKKAFTNDTDLTSMLNISKVEVEKLKSNFSCEIKNISRLIPAEINSDFFKKAYPEKNITTEKDLRLIIKKELSVMYLKESDRKFFNDALSIFVEKTKLDLPEDFLKKWLKSNAKKEILESDFEREYSNYVKYLSWQLIENKICQEHDIKVTNEKLRDFAKSNILQQMKNYGNVNMSEKEIDGMVANVLKNEQESKKMMDELIVIELVRYFKSKMKINRKTVTSNEFIKLANNQK